MFDSLKPHLESELKQIRDAGPCKAMRRVPWGEKG
jgi:hypothetical protein